MTFGYDNASRRTSLAVPGQPTIIYNYNAADDLISVTRNEAIAIISYDDAVRRNSVLLPNDIATAKEDVALISKLMHTCG